MKDPWVLLPKQPFPPSPGTLRIVVQEHPGHQHEDSFSMHCIDTTPHHCNSTTKLHSPYIPNLSSIVLPNRHPQLCPKVLFERGTTQASSQLCFRSDRGPRLCRKVLSNRVLCQTGLNGRCRFSWHDVFRCRRHPRLRAVPAMDVLLTGACQT
jgi:hypothetical protein